ncbi:MAG: hypothetical protein M1483_00210 [Actinobacteria bacterium]|jgi:hypothetical protein|nr:hypothetical protein [Actinomycetota bacterium]MCL6104060.1 hypothetical protein [Actinomycetota bacterium]
MNNHEKSVDTYFEELMNKANKENQKLFEDYMRIEEVYRNAISFDETQFEVKNTTTLPRPYITTTISAR